MHGHVVTVDFLLGRGVPIDCTDLNHCSPLLVAAQYGQSLVVSYLLQKGANRLHVDINGDNALHWSAMKGQPEVVFVLLNAGLNPRQRDSFGQTPLHSACIKGDLQCVEMLLEHGGSVDDVDSNGKTPRMLAVGRKHSRLVKFLDTRDTAKTWDWRILLFGPPGRSRGPLVFFLSCMAVWAYPLYFFQAVPLTLEQYPNVHVVFCVITVFTWIMFAWARLANPGYIHPSIETYEEAVKMIGNPASWGDYSDMHNPIYNMCHACKTVRPVRAKHCRQCDRCVEDFDHHCPWIDNCVGKKNRVPFTLFLRLLVIKMLFAFFFVWKIVHIHGGNWLLYGSTAVLLVPFALCVTMVIMQKVLIRYNMTTNEHANYRRYRHFRTADGRYHNPFNRGLVANSLEYWNITEPPHSKWRATYVI